MDTTSAVGAVNAVQAVESQAQSISVPYGASLADVSSFEGSLNAAERRATIDSAKVSEMAKAAFEPLDHINREALALGNYAEKAVESGNTLSPGEIVNLTVQSQKFMFHSQLISNIANRSADGIQQLFRQQG